MPLCDMMWGADFFFFFIFCLGFFGIFEGPFPFRQEGVTGVTGLVSGRAMPLITITYHTSFFGFRRSLHKTNHTCFQCAIASVALPVLAFHSFLTCTPALVRLLLDAAEDVIMRC